MQRFLVAIAQWPAGMIRPLCIVEGETMADAAARIGCRALGATEKIVAKLEVAVQHLKLDRVMNETPIIMWVCSAENADEFKSVLRMKNLAR